MAVVSALTCYPVKGCGGIAVEHAELTATGLPGDRLYAVVGPDGSTVWQGAAPRMAAVRAAYAGTALVLRAPGVADLVVAGDPAARTVPVDVEKWPGVGVDQGDDAAHWLSDVVGTAVRLVREPDRARRARLPDPTALLVTSESSVAALNSRVRARGAEEVPMSRFRPNVVVTGWPDPHTEDRVHRMAVGAAGVGFGELAVRCAVTMVDQVTGERRGPEPLRTLADYRRADDGVTFGLKAAVLTPGRVAVGDAVTVTGWRPECAAAD